MLMVTATEKQGVAFVYDVSDPVTPTLLFLHHLSPASETQSPGLAYANRTLGDIDPESAIFLDAASSPTRKAGVMFGGAWSGTISFYEFLGCEGGGDSDAHNHSEPHDGEDASGGVPVGPRATLTAALSLAVLCAGV